MHLTAVGVEARGDVHGHAQRLGRVHRRDGGSGHAHDIAAESGSKQSIHDHNAPAQLLPPCPGVAIRREVNHAIRRERAQHPREDRRVARDLFGGHGQKDLHAGSPAEQVAGDYEPVAAVLARAAHDAHIQTSPFKVFVTAQFLASPPRGEADDACVGG